MKKTNEYFPKGVQYFRLPAEFGKRLSEISSSEQQVYLFLMFTAMFFHTLEVKASYDEMMLGTSIKTRQTLSTSIRGLVEKGWIGNIVWAKNSKNTYRLNLAPRVNRLLLARMDEKSSKMSDAKKRSLENGEERTRKFLPEKDKIQE